jgi:hypothetical protein
MAINARFINVYKLLRIQVFNHFGVFFSLFGTPFFVKRSLFFRVNSKRLKALDMPDGVTLKWLVIYLKSASG